MGTSDSKIPESRIDGDTSSVPSPRSRTSPCPVFVERRKQTAKYRTAPYRQPPSRNEQHCTSPRPSAVSKSNGHLSITQKESLELCSLLRITLSVVSSRSSRPWSQAGDEEDHTTSRPPPTREGPSNRIMFGSLEWDDQKNLLREEKERLQKWHCMAIKAFQDGEVSPCHENMGKLMESLEKIARVILHCKPFVFIPHVVFKLNYGQCSTITINLKRPQTASKHA